VKEPTERVELLDAGRRVLVGGREARIAARRGTRERPILELEGGAPTRGDAIEVPRSELELDEGHYLVDDLIGCRVVDGDRALGLVTDVLVLPATDALEVEGSLLVPLVRDAVRSIDTDARRIDVDARFFADDH
jgi:16S rRNA processing protein RimM